jgi:hypothetical protein
MLGCEGLKSLRGNTNVYVRRASAIRPWIIALEFVPPFTVGENSRPVVIIILSVRACKPELYPRAL